MTDPDPRRRRILFRATHRGTQETDRLVGGYVAPRLLGFSEAELDAIEAVMDLPDVDLADWLMGRVAIPAGPHEGLLRAMRDAAGQGGAGQGGAGQGGAGQGGARLGGAGR